VRLPLGLDESLLCQALALEALLAVGRRLHPLRDDIAGHGTLGRRRAGQPRMLPRQLVGKGVDYLKIVKVAGGFRHRREWGEKRGRREGMTGRRRVIDEEEEERPQRLGGGRGGRAEHEEEPARARTRTLRSAAPADSDDDEQEAAPRRQRLSKRSSRSALQDSDEEEGSGDDSDDRGTRSQRGKRAGTKRSKEEEEWEDEDSDEDEENDWRVDAKEVLSKLKKNRDCQQYFCDPVRSS
jgi:hypothetical protein